MIPRVKREFYRQRRLEKFRRSVFPKLASGMLDWNLVDNTCATMNFPPDSPEVIGRELPNGFWCARKPFNFVRISRNMNKKEI